MSFYENMSNENLEELQDDLNRLGVKKTEGVKTAISTLTEKIKRLKSKAKDFTLSEEESKQIKTEIKNALSDLQKEVDQSELTVAQKSEVKEKSVKFVQTIAQVERLAQGGGLSSPAAYIEKSHAESTMKAIIEETDYDKATLLFESMDVAVLSQRQASFIYSHLQALANTEVEGKLPYYRLPFLSLDITPNFIACFISLSTLSKSKVFIESLSKALSSISSVLIRLRA